jgi:hypothetical protein
MQHDNQIIASATRFNEENPDPGAERRGASGITRKLIGTRRCYVCKTIYRYAHPEYHLLCVPCAEENLAHRHARCDLRGRTAVVTGGRMKIGFHVALKLLRDGAAVLVTTRFPRDAARRFAQVPDAAEWLSRLQIYGVDFLDLPAVAGLIDDLHRRFDHLDILVNNAAQTIRRPPAYYREVRAAEALTLLGPAASIDLFDAGPGTLPDASPAALRGASPAALSGASALALRSDASPAVLAGAAETLFPAGWAEETGQPLDLREH